MAEIIEQERDGYVARSTVGSRETRAALFLFTLLKGSDPQMSTGRSPTQPEVLEAGLDSGYNAEPVLAVWAVVDRPAQAQQISPCQGVVGFGARTCAKPDCSRQPSQRGRPDLEARERRDRLMGMRPEARHGSPLVIKRTNSCRRKQAELRTIGYTWQESCLENLRPWVNFFAGL